MLELRGKYGRAKVFTENIESEAVSQIIDLMCTELALGAQVRIMPDAHYGKGVTIGTTIQLPEEFTDWKVSPNIVGVDIGCGVSMCKLDRDDFNQADLEHLDNIVRASVPSGSNVHSGNRHKEVEDMLVRLTVNLSPSEREYMVNSIGTLGGGNHFIELGIDDRDGHYWLAVHSGSRKLGQQVARAHQKIAIEDCKRAKLDISDIIAEMKAAGRHKEIEEAVKKLRAENSKLVIDRPALAYLQGEHLADYLQDMDITQRFASINRAEILRKIVKGLDAKVIEEFDSVHNFIEHKNFKAGILRKGATSAKKNQKLVIPLNMRDGSLICEGKGNRDWNCSAPHGAGRLMARSKAREELKVSDFIEQMNGIYSSSIGEGTLDEAPGAYKSAQEILENIKDTVEVKSLVKPVYNFKA